MTQKELLKEFINGLKYRGLCYDYLEDNQNYINDIMNFFLKDIKEQIDLKDFSFNDEKSKNALSNSLDTLYFNGIDCGIEVGFDLALTLMGFDPIFSFRRKELDKKKS